MDTTFSRREAVRYGLTLAAMGALPSTLFACQSDDNAVAQVIDLLANCPSRTDDANGSVWSLGWVGGDVINSIGRTETAYFHRGVSTMLRPTPVRPNDAPPSRCSWMRSFHRQGRSSRRQPRW